MDPSARPSFSDLREKFEKFSNNETIMPIKFPRKEEEDYYAMDEVINISYNMIRPNRQDQYPPQNRYSYHHDNDYELAGGLGVSSAIRRFSSEPTLDQGMGQSIIIPLSEGSSRERSLSNSYVNLPQHPVPWSINNHTANGQSKDRANTLDVPRVMISAARQI